MLFDFQHRREQAVLAVPLVQHRITQRRLAQHRLFRPVRSKPAKNPGQTLPMALRGTKGQLVL
jgi:hypothetical protein